MAITRQSSSLDDFLKLPEAKPALEYLDGEITQKVSPQLQHGWLQGQFAELINGFGKPRRLALAIPELRTTFTAASLVPDVAVLRWARIPLTPDGELANERVGVPDLAIEILSPEQSARRLAAKCRRFIAAGAALALLVNPIDRTVTRFAAGEPEATLAGDDRIDLDAVLPSFELTVRQVFATLRLA